MQNEDKLYNPFSQHLKDHFGKKVFKISIDMGFSCPNRDGKLDTKGCTYCSELGSAAIGVDPEKPLLAQIEEGKAVIQGKYKAKHFLVYFQAHSNTYADPAYLRRVYNLAIEQENVLGIIIGTRPDCFNGEIFEILNDLNKKTYLWVELGLQSANDKTLTKINRHHTYGQFLDTYHKLKHLGIRVGVHLIFGLPDEGRKEMLHSVREMARLRVDGIKLHLLHILSGTQMGEDYKSGRIKAMEFEEYVNIVCDALELLPPETIILRLTGDPVRTFLLAPRWTVKKFEVLNAINDEMKRRGSVQGRCYLP